MILSIPAAGLLLLVCFALFSWLRIVPAVTAVIGFLAVVLLGDAGWLGRILTSVAGWTEKLVGSVTVHVIGAAAAFVLFLALAIVFLHDLHPRHSTGRRTAWIGIALGVLVVSGLTGLPFLDGLRAGIVSAAGGVLSAF
jgi:hypothetical protein